MKRVEVKEGEEAGERKKKGRKRIDHSQGMMVASLGNQVPTE